MRQRKPRMGCQSNAALFWIKLLYNKFACSQIYSKYICLSVGFIGRHFVFVSHTFSLSLSYLSFWYIVGLPHLLLYISSNVALIISFTSVTLALLSSSLYKVLFCQIVSSSHVWAFQPVLDLFPACPLSVTLSIFFLNIVAVQQSRVKHQVPQNT